MEFENHESRQAYILLLVDTLKRKSEVLNNLIKITEQQESILALEQFDEDDFLQSIDVKEKQIQLLTKLDDGFEQIYQRVNEELSDNKWNYTSEIAVMQGLITSITDAGVKLQAMEMRNKYKLEAQLAAKRKDIKKSKLSSQTVTNYYKTMAKQHETQSAFYDKKN